MQRRSLLIAATGLIGAAVAAILIGEPLLADAQLSGDARALADAAQHQTTIDTALQQFMFHGASSGGESDDRLLLASSENLAQYESARNLVSRDRAALRSALQPEWLVAGASWKAGQLQAARQRTTATLHAVDQADQVLTAAVDQERLQQGFFYASVTEAKMLTAIDSQQLVGIDGLYARADRGLRVSEALMNKPNQSPGYRPVIVAMRGILDQTQKYAAALLRHDQAEADARHAAMRAGYSALAAATSQAAINANNEWNDRTFQPLIAAYHSELAATLT